MNYSSISFLSKVPFVYKLGINLRCFYRKKFVAPRLRAKINAKFSDLKIIVGTSGVTAAGWLGTDVEYLNLLNQRDWDYFFKPDSIQAILAEHVWEHLTEIDGLLAAKMCFRYLQPGGYLRVAVPDGFHADEDYVERVKVNGWGEGARDHKVLYNYVTFSSLFKTAGFQVNLLEYFDETKTLHHQNWNPDDGMIHRSIRFDVRNQDGQPHYTSLLLDAHKI